MIAELIDWVSLTQGKSRVSTNQSILFPEPATESEDHQEEFHSGSHKELTFPMDPKERTRGLPFIEDTPLKEPF